MTFDLNYRTCAFCKRQDFEYKTDDGYILFKYSTRRYAHASCGSDRFGYKEFKAMIPKHMHRDYDTRSVIEAPLKGGNAMPLGRRP